MPRSSKAPSSALRRVGRGRDRHGQRHDQRDLRLVAQAALGEEVVHQQGGLAGRRRALEGRRRDGHDHPPTLERGQHVPQLEGTGHRVELVAALHQARGRIGMQVGAQGHHEDVGLERPGVGLHPLRGGVDRGDRGLHEADPRLHDVGVAVVDVGRQPVPEHHVELREAEHEPVGLVDQHDVRIVAQRLRQPCRQLQPPEPCPQHQHAHPRTLPKCRAPAQRQPLRNSGAKRRVPVALHTRVRWRGWVRGPARWRRARWGRARGQARGARRGGRGCGACWPAGRPGGPSGRRACR